MIEREEIIGPCRLLLGDSLKILPTLGPVDHVITDPPYEQISQDRIGGIKRNDGGAVTEKITFAGIDNIRASVAEITQAICAGWAVFFCTSEGVALWRDAIEAARLKYKSPMIWIKPDAMPKFNGQGPALGHENMVTAWCGPGHSRWNSGGKRGVYTYPVNPPDRHGKHPTEKPWRLFAELLTDFTDAGQLVSDPFMGSGTTGVAAIRTGRRFIGIEKNPEYFEVAYERIRGAFAQPDLLVDVIPEATVQQDFLG